jgi:hypothetical protein
MEKLVVDAVGLNTNENLCHVVVTDKSEEKS